GNGEVAESAIWKAIRLRRGNPYAYAWGLDLFAPKWFADDAQREKIAKLAASDHYDSSKARLHVAEALYAAGWPDLAQRLLRSAAERERLRDFIAAEGLPPLIDGRGR